jgi:hypothetical protein
MTVRVARIELAPEVLNDFERLFDRDPLYASFPGSPDLSGPPIPADCLDGWPGQAGP